MINIMIEKYQQKDQLQIFNASAQAYFLFKSKCKVNYNSLFGVMLYSLVLKESRILSGHTLRLMVFEFLVKISYHHIKHSNLHLLTKSEATSANDGHV